MKYLKLIYDDLKTEVIKEVKGQKVALTTDMWSSVANQGYITWTAHFLTKATGSWVIKNRVLATRNMAEKHTGTGQLA